jgi:hypothetical protein
MPGTEQYYQLVIRNAADDADLLILSSFPDDDNPFLTGPPSGDGQSIDPITGAATTGSYSFRFADVETATATRVLTSVMADVYARQQLISLRAYGKISADGSSWTTLIPGYVLGVRLQSAIEGEISIGDTRRRESSREVFRQATGRFSNVTTVIGGPVLEDFAGLLTDNGGWTYEVGAVFTAPNYVRLNLATNGGFDPRKSPGTTFSSVSTAIADYTNDWARGYFEPATEWVADTIMGHFPQLRALLRPITNPGDDIILTPLARPSLGTGPWWNPAADADKLIDDGSASPLYLPSEDVDGNAFAPDVGDEFEVYVYAVPVSEANPLHWVGHPVDLWEDLRLDAGYVAGVDYDDTNLADLRALINTALTGDPAEDVLLALRITKSYKLVDFDRSVIYGPFRLSTRVVDGLVQLLSIRIAGTALPSTVVALTDLRSDEGTVWNIEEDSVVTAATLKQLRLIPWTTEETKQPDSDSLVAREWPVNTIENSDDDIPPGLAESGREVVIGDIPGTIVFDDGGDIVPVPFEQYLASLAFEIFELFGRGAAEGDLHCLSGVDALVGDQILVDLVHRPNAVIGQSPVSQRGGERRVLVIQRTEEPEGPTLRIVDAVMEEGEDTGVGGGSEEEEDVTSITAPTDPIAFASDYGEATANWVDSYPQFHTYIEWEAHGPGETTFTGLYGGEHLLLPNVFSHTQVAIGIGWVVRCRYRLTDNIAVSGWSGYSNEVTITGSVPATPTDTPTTLVATSVVLDEAHGEWVNTNAVLQIRIKWQGSMDSAGPWANVAGGSRLLVATTDEDDQPTGAALWARFQVWYVNSAGVGGPPSDWSTPVEIMV